MRNHRWRRSKPELPVRNNAAMKSTKAAVIFVLVTVTLDMLTVGLIVPVLPKLILDFLGGDMKSAADWNGVFGTVFAAMQFFFSPMLGVLSDRFGRRPTILLSNLGLGHRGAVLTLYLLGAVGGGAAVLVSYLSARVASLVGALALALIFAGVVYLERAPYERQTGKTPHAS